MTLHGTYLGLTPTDESGIGAGEIEITFGDEALTFRLATGLEILSEEMPRALLRELTVDELAEFFIPEADLTEVLGYILDEDGPIFLCLAPDPDFPEAHHTLVLQFGIGAFMGPTILFTPEQVQAGYFEAAVKALEDEQGDPGAVPRLVNNGRRYRLPEAETLVGEELCNGHLFITRPQVLDRKRSTNNPAR